MKLGVFDSGLGGLIVAKALREHFPDLDMVYLGDTLHLPYGNRSEAAIYAYTLKAMKYLFEQQDCALIIVACNTASAAALRRLQQTWLAENYPERRILGVVVPTLEAALDRGFENIGLIGTNYIVHSGVYAQELQKINPRIKLVQQKTPLLVPLIEHEGAFWLESVLDHYLKPLLAQNIESLLLGCTHYACLKEIIRRRVDVDVISQDEIIPFKLEDYLQRHPEMDSKLGNTGLSLFYVTDLTQSYKDSACEIYGSDINIQTAVL